MNDTWINWTRTNLDRKCDPAGIIRILLDNGFCPPEIEAAMGPRYRPDMITVDYSKLSQLRIISPDSGAVTIGDNKAQMFTFEDFLSSAECNELLSIIRPNMRPSTVTVESCDKNFRTSTTCNLSEIDCSAVTSIECKIAKVLGISPEFSEPIQAQRYLPGQQFKSHTDYFEPCTIEYVQHCSVAGNRTWTFMVYLNEVEQGGATSFPELEISFLPKPGRALVWNNLYPDGSPNPHTKHSGDPVIAGEKVILTKWFREKGRGEMFL